MKTLVTGGLGFIGSHLVKKLLENNREVVIFDLSDSLKNLESLGIDCSKIEIVKIDLADYSNLRSLFDRFEFDCVFHLAARVGGLKYLHDNKNAEIITLQENIAIDSNVFRCCLEKNISKIIYASSIAVYSIEKQFNVGAVFKESEANFSMGEQGEFKKFVLNINPDGGYGLAKALGEMQLSCIKDAKIGIARLFNIYGPNLPLGEKSHVITDLFQKIIDSNGEITIWGNGQQTRDFLYIDDCIKSLLLMEEKIAEENLILNIGSGQTISIQELAQKIAQTVKKEITINFDLSKPVGPVSRTADISLAKTKLEWNPEISMDQGLAEVYNWYSKK